MTVTENMNHANKIISTAQSHNELKTRNAENADQSEVLPLDLLRQTREAFTFPK